MKSIKIFIAILIMIFYPRVITAENYGEPLSDCIDESQFPNAVPAPDSLSLGVLFIQFADWQTNINARGSVDSVISGTSDTIFYKYRDYYNLLVSENYYKTDANLQPPYPLSPHGEDVYGSMVDYYNEISYDKFKLNVTIINPYHIISGDTLLVWLTASNNKDYYDNLTSALSSLYYQATNQAINNGWISTTGDYQKYAIVYAGDRNDDSDNNRGLWPRAGGNRYIMEEKNFWVPREFSDIGTHVHEFGHLLGLPDLYGNSRNCSTGAKRGIGSFSLMASGSGGFQGGREQRPTHMCAWSKLVLGWVNPVEITSNIEDRYIPNLEQNDTAYVYYISGSMTGNWYSDEYFIIENRQPIGFDGDFKDQSGQGGGLLIYHKDQYSIFPNGEYIDLEEADGGNDLDIECGDYGSLADFFPGTTDNKSFAPWSNPNSYSHAAAFTDFAVLDINQNGLNISADLYSNSPPKTPSNFRITGRPGESATLRWNANNDPDLQGYKIYRKSDGQNQFFHIATVSQQTISYTDNQVTISRFGPGIATYHITAIDNNQNESDPTYDRWVSYNILWKILSENLNIPDEYGLIGNVPNPFNPITTIKYQLPEESIVVLKIYDLMGREIKILINKTENAGFKNVIWDAKDKNGRPVSSGMYFYRLDVVSMESREEFHKTKKMLLLR
ncbi:MAG: immune inhibitor A [Bacteroidetes bacterium]|nr:immune inhibitor A [Bacteroidota bacterium]